MVRRAAVVVIGLVVVAACGGSSSGSAKVNRGGASSSTSSTTAASGGPVIGDSVTTPGGNELAAYSWEQPAQVTDSFGVAAPDPGNEFAAADVGVCLAKDRPVAGASGLTPALYSVEMADHTRREAELAWTREPALHSTQLSAPGDCVRGWVTFQVPEGQRPERLIFTSRTSTSWEIPPGSGSV